MRKLGTMLTAMLFRFGCAASDASIPCTGDAFPMYTWVAVMILALIALIVAVIFFWKSMK